MTLENFIHLFGKPGAVVLLEGKRKVDANDAPKLSAIGYLLASRMPDVLFRSGNAPGADELFAAGVAAVDVSRMQVVTPHAGHRANQSKGFNTVALDQVQLATEPEVIYESRQDTRNRNLVDAYVNGTNRLLAVKGAYLIRDTVKVVGVSGVAPASVGLFYDDLSKPATGGTGFTMDVCLRRGVPVIDQRIWFKWLEE